MWYPLLYIDTYVCVYVCQTFSEEKKCYNRWFLTFDGLKIFYRINSCVDQIFGYKPRCNCFNLTLPEWIMNILRSKIFRFFFFISLLVSRLRIEYFDFTHREYPCVKCLEEVRGGNMYLVNAEGLSLLVTNGTTFTLVYYCTPVNLSTFYHTVLSFSFSWGLS